MEKGENARFEQFPLFHNIFLYFFFFNVLKWVYMEERVYKKRKEWKFFIDKWAVLCEKGAQRISKNTDPCLRPQFVRTNMNRTCFAMYTFSNCSGSLVVRASASWAGGQDFDPRPRQTKVFKTGSGGFPPWRSGLWE